jgi:hypothetical protein
MRRWSWLPVLVIGALLYQLVLSAVQGTRNSIFVPTLILLGSAVVPVAFVAFVSGRDLRFGVTAWVV